MGKPKTLLADICDFAAARGADSLEVEFDEGELVVYAHAGNTGVSIAQFPRSGRDAKELLANLYSAAKEPARALIGGRPSDLHVIIRDSFGDHAFDVKIKPATSSAPPESRNFTKKQGQYLSFIYHYSKIHRRAPSESDIQQYFQVSAPSIHNMILTLDRAGLIERTPGEARSIKVLVPPDRLPPLE
jgi:LexA DNA binding domain